MSVLHLPLISALIPAVLGCAAAADAAPKQEPRPVPYWASIATDHARLRKGPAETLPVLWDYQRENLPVKVLAVHENWRKVRDPDGTEGWMAARLLSAKPTAIVIGATASLRDEPAPQGAVRYRVEAGVVGRVRECDEGWCLFEVGRRRGWIEAQRLWGGHD